MVVHTHEDVDQLFSRISTRIQRLNIPTLPHLLREIPNSYLKSHTTAERLTSVFNVRDWLSGSIEPMHQHSKPHIFKICRGEDGKAVMSTKLWSTSDWEAPVGTSHLLRGHPEGEPAPVKADFTAMDLLRLNRQIEKLSSYLTEDSRRQWRITLDQLQREEQGRCR